MGGEGSYHVNEEPEASSDVGICSGTARYPAAEVGLWAPTAQSSAPVPGLVSQLSPSPAPPWVKILGLGLQVATLLSE